MPGSLLVLQSCHEEICSGRAADDDVRRAGIRHLALQQEKSGSQGPAIRAASPGRSPEE